MNTSTYQRIVINTRNINIGNLEKFDFMYEIKINLSGSYKNERTDYVIFVLVPAARYNKVESHLTATVI